MEASPDQSQGSGVYPPRLTRAEWGLVLVLVAIQFTHMVDFVIIMPLGGRLMDEFAMTTGQFGAVVSAYAWSAGLASLLASLVMDRFDRRHVLLAMYGGFTVSTLACGLAYSYETLLISRALAGAFGGLAAVCIMAVIGDLFVAEKRGRASGAVMSSFAVASIAGLPIGLDLAEAFGRGAPFIAISIFSSAVWVLTWVRLPNIRGHLMRERRYPLRDFANVLSVANHRWAFAFSLFLVLGTFTVVAFIGPYLTGKNGWSEKELKVIYFVAGLCTLVGMNIVGRLADRLGRRVLFRWLAGAAIVAAVVITNLPPSSLALAAIVLSLFMVFAAGRMIPAQAILLGASAPEMRGSFLSVNTAVQHLSTGLAPMVAGAVLTRTPGGQIKGYPLVGIIAAASAVVALVLIGKVHQYVPPVVVEPRQDLPDVVAEPKSTAV